MAWIPCPHRKTAHTTQNNTKQTINNIEINNFLMMNPDQLHAA